MFQAYQFDAPSTQNHEEIYIYFVLRTKLFMDMSVASKIKFWDYDNLLRFWSAKPNNLIPDTPHHLIAQNYKL